METPEPIAQHVDFRLDDRQREIRDRLQLLGPELVSYFTDACRIMSGSTGLASQTHLAAHMLREIDGRIREVLRPMLSGGAKASIKAARDDTHRAEIIADGAILGLDGPSVEQWIEYALPLFKFAHRASLAGPRDIAEFREHFSDGQAVLLAVLRRLEAIYVDAGPIARQLAAKPHPTGDDLSTLRSRIPHSKVVLGEFFSRASLAWFPLLRDAGYFRGPDPREPDEEGLIRYVEWPPGRFLVRAANAGELQPEVAEILDALETDNPEARDVTVEAALEMPAPVAARLAPKIAGYVRESGAWWVPRHSEELIEHLVDGGEIAAALEISDPLLDAQPRGADWRMRHAFTDLVPKLFPAAGIDGLAMLRGMLSEELTREGREVADYSTIWRESIAGGHDLQRRDLLVAAINGGAGSLVESGAVPLRDVVTALTVDGRAIFKRIALHVISEYPEPEVAAEWLGDEEVFRDRNLEREYAELARAAFAPLEDDRKQQIFGWIHAGPTWRPQDLEEDDISDFDDYWRLRRLRALPEIRPEWQERYEEMISRLGDPGDPLLATRVTIGSGTRSPIEKDAIASLGDDALLEFVDGWEPGDDWRGPSVEGLASALRDAAMQAPERFSNLLPEFLRRPSAYARHIVYGLEHVVQEGGALEWPPVLRFADGALARAGEGDGHIDDDNDPTWTWARIEVLRLLLYAIERGALPSEHADAVWAILAPLTEDPDPTPESEDDDELRGSSVDVQSWNRVRSLATSAVIRFAAWLRTQAGADMPRQLPENVREVLERRIDPTHEKTRTVAVVFGRHFNQLYDLDPEWAAAHLREIFPDKNERRAAHRLAAWTAFVTGNRFWRESWDVLAPEYEHALRDLTSRPPVEEEDDSPDGDADALLGHLFGAYLADRVELSDQSLLGQLFDTAPLPIRARFLEMIGMDVSNADEISPEVRDKLARLWEWRSEQVVADGNPTELAPFAWWFGSGNLDDHWSLEQLIRVLEAGGGVSYDYPVTQRLAELADAELALVVHATALLIERAYTPQLVLGAQEELRRILGAGLASADERVVAEARGTVSRLYAQRHVEFRQLIDAC